MANEETQMKLDDAGIVSKLTMASIRCNPSAVNQMSGDNPELPLATFYGVCNGLYTKVDKVKGDVYNGFRGTFEAVNLQTGELYHSGVMYLPGGISEQFQSVVEQHTKDGQVSLDFGFQINSIPSSSPAKYAYKAFALRKAQEADPLEQLRSEMRKAIKGKVILEGRQLTGKK